MEDPISGTVEEVNSLEDQTDVEDNVIVKNNQNEATSDLASRSLAEDSGSVLLDVKKDKNEAIDDNISELSDIFREKAKPIGTIQMSASKLDAENSLGEKEEENSFKSEAEQEPTDYVMSDPRSRGKMRLKSRPLELPPVSYFLSLYFLESNVSFYA